jgi:hypothetical protein
MTPGWLLRTCQFQEYVQSQGPVHIATKVVHTEVQSFKGNKSLHKSEAHNKNQLCHKTLKTLQRPFWLQFLNLCNFQMFSFLSCGFAVMQFFASDQRIKAVRQMIMAATTAQRQVALDKLLPYQRSDFEGIFRVMDGML